MVTFLLRTSKDIILIKDAITMNFTAGVWRDLVARTNANVPGGPIGVDPATLE